MPAALSSSNSRWDVSITRDFSCIGLVDRDEDDLSGCDAGRQNKTLVVAVDHDDGADHASGQAPGSGLAVLQVLPGSRYWISKALAKFWPK